MHTHLIIIWTKYKKNFSTDCHKFFLTLNFNFNSLLLLIKLSELLQHVVIGAFLAFKDRMESK